MIAIRESCAQYIVQFLKGDLRTDFSIFLTFDWTGKLFSALRNQIWDNEMKAKHILFQWVFLLATAVIW